MGSTSLLVNARQHKMKVLITLMSLIYMSTCLPMHVKPPLSKAVCDNQSFLIFPETGWCFAPNTQGPCKIGELFMPAGSGNIGQCKNMRQVVLLPFVVYHV